MFLRRISPARGWPIGCCGRSDRGPDAGHRWPLRQQQERLLHARCQYDTAGAGHVLKVHEGGFRAGVHGAFDLRINLCCDHLVAGIERELASIGDQRVLRWFGHVERMDDYRMTRRVLTAGTKETEVRQDGWCDGGFWQQRMTVEAVRQCAKDKKEWRAR